MNGPTGLSRHLFTVALLRCVISNGQPHCCGAPRDLTAQEIAARALPAIVGLTARNATGNPSKYGSGVVVGENLVVTCLHVVNGAHSVTANFSDGRSEDVPGLM